MQIVTELSLAASLAALLFSVMLSFVLVSKWYKQENRLLTDLPLMFGISFISMSTSQLMLVLPSIGLAEDTFLFFQVRAFVILWTTLPLLGASLHIWSRRSQKTHLRILTLLAGYWIGVILLGPSREIIMLFHLPILLGLMLALGGTFAVTWKTGRLKEVRSELMLASLVLMIFSQGTRVAFMVAGLDFVSLIINSIGIGLAALALINPWHKRTSVDKMLSKPSATVSYSQ